MAQDAIKQRNDVLRLDLAVATLDQQVAKLTEAPHASLYERLL